MHTIISQKYKPSIPRRWLFFLAGLLWTIAGGILCWRAVNWLGTMSLPWGAVLVAVGLGVAVPGYLFGFSRLVKKNVQRISDLPDRPCLFAFSPWRGYGMIALMMSTGIFLRNSPLPVVYLIIPYLAMGMILIGSSVHFFHRFLSSIPKVHSPE